MRDRYLAMPHYPLQPEYYSSLQGDVYPTWDRRDIVGSKVENTRISGESIRRRVAVSLEKFSLSNRFIERV